MNIIESNLQWHGELTDGNIPKRIILHHAAGDGTVEQIHQEHLNRGWCGIGYHYYVRKDGNIYKGRPDCAIGAHCLGYNTNSLGICAEGNFMAESMLEVQKNAIIELVTYLKGKYSITDIKGHKELNSTDCPGANYPLEVIKNANITVPSQPQTVDIHLYKYLQHEVGTTEDNIPGPITLSKCPLVQIGANSNVVKWVQTKLNITSDGIFGNQTKITVQNFQARHGLVADGIIGQNTWKKLLGL